MATQDKNKNMSIQDATVQSLWNLYQNALMEDEKEASEILSGALERFEQVRDQYCYSAETESIFKLYRLLKGFLSLNKTQQQSFLQQIEHSDRKVIYGFFPR